MLVDDRNKAASEEPPKQWTSGNAYSRSSSCSEDEHELYIEDEGLTNGGVGIPFDKAFIKLTKIDLKKA